MTLRSKLLPDGLGRLFLGALVHWTHSIYPAILAHAINSKSNKALSWTTQLTNCYQYN